MIGVIKYGSGNTRSVANALTRLEQKFVLSDDINVLDTCEKIIFPGVGAAGAAMNSLHENGLVDWIKSCEKPFLGICLGFQILFDSSEEKDTECLGIIPGKVKMFAPTKIVPHMGWNTISSSSLSEFEQAHFYFVHGYYAPVNAHTLASCTYEDETFSAVVRKNNFWGAQFHPEKSGKVGQGFLSYFLAHE